MIKIKILKESKYLLNEAMTYAEALASLNNKKFNNQLISFLTRYPEKTLRKDLHLPSWIKGKSLEEVIKYIKDKITYTIPNDIPENNKDANQAICVIWLKNRFDAKNFETGDGEMFLRLGTTDQQSIKKLLEDFYIRINLVEEKDLNKIPSFESLHRIVRATDQRFEDLEQEKANKEAVKEPAKIEILSDGSEWEIAIPWNKSAAIIVARDILPTKAIKLVSAGKQPELMKQTKCTTEWCTAGIGINLWDQYHTDDSPLFVFVNKKDVSEKYQFSYSHEQYMDKKDQPIGETKKFYDLHTLLIGIPGIKEKYPVLNKIKDVKKIEDEYYDDKRKIGKQDTYYLNKHKILEIDDEGNVVHYNKYGNAHRVKAPAKYNKYTYEKDPKNAPQQWYIHGDHSRVDGGPAEINEKGTKFWYINGNQININPEYKYGGPMVVKADGTKVWRIGLETFFSEEDWNKYIEDALNNEENYNNHEVKSVKDYLNGLNAVREKFGKYVTQTLKENKKIVIKILKNNSNMR